MIAGGLAFLISVAFWPGIMGAAVTPRWAILSIVVPLLVFGARATMTLGHVLGLSFLAWCAVTVFAAPTWEGYDQIWKFLLLAGLFCWSPDMRRFFIGLGLGCAVNLAFAVAQLYGWFVWPGGTTNPGGLFLNSGWLGEFSALTLIGLIGYRVWWLVPFPACLVVLSGARGAVMGLGAAFAVGLWQRSKIAAVALLALMAAVGAVLLFDGSHDKSGIQRVIVWRETLTLLTWHGEGLGSYLMAYPQFGFMFINAHNDLLQIARETGLGVFLFAGFILFAMFGSTLTERCVLACFMVEGLVGYPLYMPGTAFIAAVVAGRLCRDRVRLRDSIATWRMALSDGSCRPKRTSAVASLRSR